MRSHLAWARGMAAVGVHARKPQLGGPAVPPGTDVRPLRRRAWVLDAIAVVLVGGWTFRLESLHFWNHNYVNLTWGDWLAHAYRALFFQTYGLTNWDPDWNNGLPLFQGYQTLPHVLTVWLGQVTGATITHSMIMWTALLLLLLPVSGYLVLRSFGLGAAGAFVGAALLLDNADIGSPIGDFSYLFGVALIPILVWIVVKLIGTRAGYLGAIVIGLTPYLHPYATTAAAVLLIARAVYDRRSMLTWRTAVQGGIALAVSSFYWIPYLLSARPKYEDPWNYSLTFEHSLLAVNGLHGFSIAVIMLGIAAVGALLIRGYRFRRFTSICMIGAGVMAVLAMGSYWGWFPAAIVQLEFVRLLPEVGAVAAMGAAPLGEVLWGNLRKLRLPRDIRVPIGVAVIALVVGAILFEGRYWFHNATVPVSDTVAVGSDLLHWANEQPNQHQPMIVLTNSNDVAYTSYVAFGRYHFPGDYIVTRQWTVAEPLLNENFQGSQPGEPSQTGDFSELGLLMRMYGVQYVFLSDYLPANQSFIDGPLKGQLNLVQKLPDGWMAQVPWTPVTAFVAPVSAAERTTLPNLTFATPAEEAVRQQQLKSYVNLAYSSTAQPAQIDWIGPTELTIHATASPGGLLVVPQNWDTVWSARADGQSLPVERVGPNFVGIRLGSRIGPITVDLVHGPYPTWTGSLALSAVGILIGIVLFVAAWPRWKRSKG